MTDQELAIGILSRLLRRRCLMEALGLCAPKTPCAWTRRALDRAIVSQILLLQSQGQDDALHLVLAAQECGERPLSRAA